MIFTLEYLYFNPQSQFYKFTIHDYKTGKSFTRILNNILDERFDFTNISISNDKYGKVNNSQIEDFIKLTFDKDKLHNNKNLKNKLKLGLVNYNNLIKSEETFSLFDSFENLWSFLN